MVGEVAPAAASPGPDSCGWYLFASVFARSKIREGWFEWIVPATFPSGEGNDLAGIVTKLGPGVEGFAASDEVIGFTDARASHAEYVIAEGAELDGQARECVRSAIRAATLGPDCHQLSPRPSNTTENNPTPPNFRNSGALERACVSRAPWLFGSDLKSLGR
jgi:hypothetical protein